MTRGRPSKGWERLQTESERAHAQGVPTLYEEPPRSTIHGARFWLTHTTHRGFRSMFHMPRDEFMYCARRLSGSIVLPPVRAGYDQLDVIALIVCMLAINATLAELSHLFQISVSTVDRLVQTHLRPLASRADELWIHKDLGRRQTGQTFTSSPGQSRPWTQRQYAFTTVPLSGISGRLCGLPSTLSLHGS
jgi:hypothetical protein